MSLRLIPNVEYDIDYYKSLIEGGYVKDNDLWIFWMKTESHSPNEIRELHAVCEELKFGFGFTRYC